VESVKATAEKRSERVRASAPTGVVERAQSRPARQVDDTAPESGVVSQLQAMADRSPRVGELAQLRAMLDGGPRQQAQRMQSNRQMAGDAANRTGLPNQLKAGLEELSGVDLSAVRVRFNSPKPAQMSALAYAQGTNIYVGPGQERHLPHEGWHAVQQMQGRVRPTSRVRGAAVNDDAGLEHEADVMGAMALQRRAAAPVLTSPDGLDASTLQMMKRAWDAGDLGDLDAAVALQRKIAEQPGSRATPAGPPSLQFATSDVVQLEGGIWNFIWEKVAALQNLSFYDFVLQIIELSSAITSVVAASADDSDVAVASASLALVAAVNELAAANVAHRQADSGGGTSEEALEASAKLFAAAINVLGAIGTVIAAKLGGGSGAIAGIVLTKAASKALTAAYVGYRKYRQREVLDSLMGGGR